MKNPFRYFDSSPEVICLAVMMYVRFPFSQRNVEDVLAERGIDICQETVRLWWNRFGPMFAAEIRRKRVDYGLIVPFFLSRRGNVDGATYHYAGRPGAARRIAMGGCIG